ncbi:arylesterase [Erythrobacter sp. QSSC1-22B]|uniref:arylesterase n=1 Tax=Erythrobacter sp. QSSC1-22B TaxID=1860125 RepID=UPI000805F1B6|nr:arylesterase [Erythrobacter sp. QSSC1-22B]OBX20775.1 arylesterase [Erythrobacter sp. QSSC1-22B]
MHIGNWSIGCAALALAACSGEAGEVPAAAEETSVEAPAPEVAVSGEERRILAFGNSLFAGYGLAEAEGYPERLEAALRGEGVNARVIDAGVSGDTSAAGRQRLAFTLDGLETPPDLVLLELGGNDLIRGLSPEETRANFEAMLGELRTRDIPVVIMGMRAPPNYGPEFQQSFDSLYGELAQEYEAQLVPFWLESIYQDPSLFQSDRIHPTAPGIEALVADTLDDVRGALPQAE